MNILTIEATPIEELLNTDAYGSAAIVAIEASATGGGVGFTEIATLPLVAGTEVYTYFHVAGVLGTFYRTRYSRSDRSVQSEFGAEFQILPGDPLLTPTEFRGFVSTALGDDELRQLLDAAAAEILAYAGAPDAALEIIDGGHPRLALQRRAISVTSISETRWHSTTPVTLSADDYRLRAGGYVIERLNTGSNPRSWWHGLVTVSYALASTDAVRRMVQVDLVKLAISLDSNLSSHTIGDFSESFDTSKSPEDKRDEILSRLTGEPGIVVVGG